MTRRVFKAIMLFLTGFIGIGAMFGGICMLIKPDGSVLGMNEMLHYFKVLPFSKYLFQNFIFPGISLIIVNGISNLIAFVLIIKNKSIGAKLGMTFGITLMLWITIQFIIFPANFLSITYFILGALQFICGWYYYVLFEQSQFIFNEDKYTNININNDELVVFFSREGYSKKIAYERANQSGAYLYEVKSSEKTDGYAGFWWCGRFGMHSWGMPIMDCDMDLSSFKKVIIVTPVWVFKICGPIREFCKKAKHKIANVEYIAVHFRKDSSFKNAFAEMNELLGITADKQTSICCKYGKVIKIKEI